MGPNNSKATKEVRERKARVHANLVKENVNKIEEFEQKVVQMDQSQIQSCDQIDILKMSDMAKAQVQRGSAALTKADLIAIILRLRNEVDYGVYAELTVKDLNIIIRTIIYSPPEMNSKSGTLQAELQHEEQTLQLRDRPRREYQLTFK